MLGAYLSGRRTPGGRTALAARRPPTLLSSLLTHQNLHAPRTYKQNKHTKNSNKTTSHLRHTRRQNTKHGGRETHPLHQRARANSTPFASLPPRHDARAAPSPPFSLSTDAAKPPKPSRTLPPSLRRRHNKEGPQPTARHTRRTPPPTTTTTTPTDNTRTRTLHALHSSRRRHARHARPRAADRQGADVVERTARCDTSTHHTAPLRHPPYHNIPQPPALAAKQPTFHTHRRQGAGRPSPPSDSSMSAQRHARRRSRHRAAPPEP
jgi:hypothetical protein